MSFKDIGENLEQYVLDIMDNKRHAPIDLAFRAFLFFASRVYRNIIQFRIWLYDKRIIRNRAIGCLVVSIGNLTCGGTGKTPVVEVFSKTLSKKGRTVAILSRGYRSKKRSIWTKLKQRFSGEDSGEIPPKIVSDGKNILLGSDYAGDEPYMLATNLKNVIVLVDKDRVKSGLYAIRKFQADTLILDDGFQYLDLKPHINIVLVDSTSPFHNHHVLPRGLLREPIKNLRRADYIFLTKSNGGNHLRHLKNFLRRHNRRAEIIECCHKPQYLQNIYTDEQKPLDFLKGLPIAAISAIAKPESFEAFLRELGGNIVYREDYVDHHRYTRDEVVDFIEAAKAAKAKAILTTEKDAVRFPEVNDCGIPIYYLRVQIEILSGHENFEKSIERICFFR